MNKRLLAASPTRRLGVGCLLFVCLLVLYGANQWSEDETPLVGAAYHRGRQPLGNTGPKSDCVRWRAFVASYRKCLLRRLAAANATTVWDRWATIVRLCLAGHVFPDMHFLKNLDDVKVAFLPNSTRRQPCTVVTLGVGGDIMAEQKLKALRPTCEFFGADPIEKYGKIYSEIGKYTPVAVGAKGGAINASVKVDQGHSYTSVTLKSVSLRDYLLTSVNRSRIDHLWVDNEGPEYRMLPLFERNGEIERAGVEVCQLNVELHGPLANYSMTRHRFGDVIRRFTRRSALLPLYVYPPVNHYRAFFFNVDSRHCVRKYFPNVCRLKAGRRAKHTGEKDGSRRREERIARDDGQIWR